MSKYTTQLRWIVEQENLLHPYTPTEAQRYSNYVYRKLGLDKYPIFREEYRRGLNDKIIDHYYVREIGAETAGLFAMFVRRTMNEQMPYFNQLYESTLLKFDPMDEVDMRYTDDGESSSTGTANGTNKARNRQVFQDTPMSMLDTDPSAVENLEYATNVTYNDGGNDSRTDSESAGTYSGRRTEKGRRTRAPYLLREWRETFLNIDMMVIESLEDCFFKLW